ncbi:hypothetical protein [Maribacter sp. Asnod2-G09]|uniref:hypothetical protein n=1 Tax=Maribacter sp. Asnod2-G09 TaxID=3160577 RepID=UPI003866F12F
MEGYVKHIVKVHLKKGICSKKSLMDDKINIDLRSKILQNALFIEDGINGLLIGYLAIFDKEKTKNFGNKAGIPFKSKIDLLFDINVLNKEEHFNLELQMIFRNKFLHDLNFNSFRYAIENLDNGIINKLNKFIEDEDGEDMDIEEKYWKAYYNLYGANAKMILKKFQVRDDKITERKDFIVGLTSSFETAIDLSFGLVSDINQILEDSDLKHPKILELSNKILSKCKLFTEKMMTEPEMIYNRQLIQNTKISTLEDLLK